MELCWCETLVLRKKVKLTKRQALARGPVELSASKNVDVQVVDRLAPLNSIVDDHSVALNLNGSLL